MSVHMLTSASITFLKTLTQCHEKNKIKIESRTANALESSKKKGKERKERHIPEEKCSQLLGAGRGS